MSSSSDHPANNQSMSSDADRAAVLAKRRELRKAKKLKGRQFKEEKRRERDEKKKQILARIREKREAEKQAPKGNRGGSDANGDGCWLCGETDHQKQHCPNKAAGDLTKTCFKCRRRGHTSQNCPSNNGNGSHPLIGGGQQQQQQKLVCFNCGADDHALRDCSAPRVNGGATYATCFVCNQMGHLSSQCPQSKTGIYPKGGCCKLCQSVTHLARDCPAGKISADGGASARQNKKKTFGDDDDDDNSAAMAMVDPKDTTGDALDGFELPDDDDDEGTGAGKDRKGRRGHKGKASGSRRDGKY